MRLISGTVTSRKLPDTATLSGWRAVPDAPFVISPFHLLSMIRAPTSSCGLPESRCGGRKTAAATSTLSHGDAIVFESRSCRSRL